jgi:hypothetical protein
LFRRYSCQPCAEAEWKQKNPYQNVVK